MTVNMGPQHPSTHGVLRLVLQLDGETVTGADTTIGFLHTGIEKTAEQKKWQQVIPLVERMDYLGAQSNSLAFCLSVEKLLEVELPQRVKDIRVLIAELQRLASHLVWLATHALEIGAVSVMMYCFREREQLLNINEMLAGFRMFPSYIRIGGLREDLPTGFHEAVRFVARHVPGEAERVRGPAHEEPDLAEAHEGRRHHRRGDRRRLRPRGADGARRGSRPTTSARRSRTSATRRTTSTCRRRRAATSTTATWCGWRRCARASASAARRSARITPRGVFDIQDYRIVPPPKDKVYTEMEGLIQHFLIYSQGFTVPAGDAYVPVEGPRGEHGWSIVSDGTNRPYASSCAPRRSTPARRCRRRSSAA
jgi:NADH-quinone oxidoreductase subunit D